MKQLLSMLGISLLTLAACKGKHDKQNQLSEQDQQAGWVALFDGKSLAGWHVYNKGNGPSAWQVVNGELSCIPDPKLEPADLVSDSSYDNYVLRFEWKISKGGNSGVFVNVVERADIPAAWASGPEYQLLDKSHPDSANPIKQPGCLYGFAPQLHPAASNPTGEWNQGEIKQQNGKISFYLNGIQTAEQDFTLPGWKDSVAHTFFKNFPEFGAHTSGHIALQDWRSAVSFRNIAIRKL
jgi:hypothetical protein